MKREELEKFLGAKVTITLDNECVTGFLHKTSEAYFKNDPNINLLKNRYFATNETAHCISCLFRSSHVIRCTLYNYAAEDPMRYKTVAENIKRLCESFDEILDELKNKPKNK